MKKKPLIPFSLMPGSWGLKGKTREIAQAEYELEQRGLEERLLEIEYRNDPGTLAQKKLALFLSREEISQYEYEIEIIELTIKDVREKELAMLDVKLKHGKLGAYEYEQQKAFFILDENEHALALLDSDLRHEKITQTQYDRKRADILKEPWVCMPKINWDPVNSNRTYFELDYNEYFVQYLRDNGYSGAEDDVLNRWLNDVCQAVANEAAAGMDFVVDNTR